MIKLTDISKKIKNKILLNNINLEFHEGNVYCLKGSNGSGKTMLLRLICKLITPSNGNLFFSRDMNFGVIIENPSFLENETALYNLRYLAKIRNKISDNTIFEYLKKFGLYEHKDERVKTFSLGMKQRLAIIQALMENPDVLLFDEPFNGLDEKNLKVFLEELYKEKEKNKIIIIASHYLSEEYIDIFDELIEIDNGQIKQ